MTYVQRDSSAKDKSVPVINIPWDVAALKAALLLTEIWEILEFLKVK